MIHAEINILLGLILDQIAQVDADVQTGRICERTATQRRNALLDAILYL